MVDHDQILKEIVEMTAVPVLKPTDITLIEYAEAAGMSRDGARGKLKTLVDQGVLETGKKKDPSTGRIVRCYWKPLDSEG